MAAQGGTDDRSGVEITRWIPIPGSVSPEAQQFLGMGLDLGEGGSTREPALDDVEGWRAMIQAANDGLGFALGLKTANLPSTVETVSMAGVPVHVALPEGISDVPGAPVYLDVHGGGFTIGGGETCGLMAQVSAAQVQLPTFGVDYRMPPDHPYPAALDDCVAVYGALLETHAPDRIVIGGGSAGGNLAAALVLRARDEGFPMPAALVLLTPEADLTESGDTFATNLGLDNVLTASLAGSIALYAGDHDITHPYLSPLFGDLTPPFPPTFLQSGTRDLFLSNTVRMHRKLRAGGVDAELHVFEAMPHGGFWDSPEDVELTEEIRRFIAAHI